MIEAKGKSKEEILAKCKEEIDALDVGLKPTAEAFKEVLGRIDEFIEDGCTKVTVGLNEKYKTDIYIKFYFEDERLAWELDVYGDGEANWDKNFIIDKNLEYGLYLTKDKKIINCKNSIEQEYVEGMNILGVLSAVQIKEVDGWTVRDLMNLIHDSELGTFLGQIAWCKFDAFYNEMQKPNDEPSEHAEEITYIQFSRFMEINNYGDGDDLDDYVDMCGVNEENEKLTEEEFAQKAKEGDYPSVRYGVSLTPINYIADKEIRIAKNFDIFKWDTDKNKVEVYATIENSLTLYEIIYAFLWEISFHGIPDDREGFADKLNKSVAAIKDGTSKAVPLTEEWKKRMEDVLKDPDDKKD